MENLDTQTDDMHLDHDEEKLFLDHVIQDDHELLFLDVCLNEICKLQNESEI